MKLILASKSPRRSELLSMLGVKPEIYIPHVNEDCDRSVFTPEELVMGLSCRKARAASEEMAAEDRDTEDCVLLAADTVVSLDGEILEKPKDEDDARRMLSSLSGKNHEVFTGIALVHRNCLCVDVQRTTVRFRHLSAREIDLYVASGEPMDKAGAYGIQGAAAMFVEGIDGDYYNVVGLPLVRVDECMRSAYGFGLFDCH